MGRRTSDFPVSELESHLGYWLRFVSNHVSTRFRRTIEEKGITVSEWVLLRTMYAGTLTSPTDLAEALGMTKGAVSKLLARLEEKNLTRRAVVADDRRHLIVKLTSAGRALVPQLARLADENDELFFGSLSARRRMEIQAAMMDLVRIHGLKSVPVE